MESLVEWEDLGVDTTCCVVGGGPAGVMLGLLLARAGVDCVVLEKHEDFFRDFRGDTIHPSTLDLIDQLGLREKFEAIAHTRVTTLDAVVNGNRLTPVDFSTLKGKNKEIALMPQWDLLQLLAEEGARYPGFRLVMGAEATGLLRGGASGDGEWVTGVVATIGGERVEISARLTVAADGRGSVLRAASGLETREYGVPIDVLWFRMPRPAVTPPDTLVYLDAHTALITIPRPDYYQCGLLVPKGSFPAAQAAGLDAFRAEITGVAPFLAPVVGTLDDWSQVKLLTVQVNRLDKWWLPGFLCIGDAAHAMSPAFGVGVNYAIQDAVAAATILSGPLRAGTLTDADLARVQARRLPPVRRMQPLQLRLHEVVAHPGGGGFLPNPMRRWQRVVAAIVLPGIRRLAARIVGRGFRPERIETEAVATPRD